MINSNKNFLHNISLKIIIFIFFITIFSIFLYLPKITNLFLAQTKVLNVYTWTDMITTNAAEEFEKKTGIKIQLKYFDSDDELLTQFKINKGKGYDLITSSDSIVQILSKEKLLQRIELNKISNLKNLDKRLFEKFKKLNEGYFLPYFWTTYGIIFKKSTFANISQKMGWDFVFKDPKTFAPEVNYKICMLDTPKESFFLASIYLFERVENITDKDLLIIKNLLSKQKAWVEVYMFSSLQYYLLADVVPLAVTASSFAKKIMEISDEFEFIIPDKGSLLAIDCLAIPAESKKADLACQFIDFLLSKDINLSNSKAFGYNPTNEKSYAEMGKNFLENKSFFPDDKMFKKLHLATDLINLKKIENLWLSIRLNN